MYTQTDKMEVLNREGTNVTKEEMTVREVMNLMDMQPAKLKIHEDFVGPAGSTLPFPWGKQDTSAAGTPTLDYVANTVNGMYRLLHDSQSEAQKLTLYWADSLHIDITKQPIFEARLKINFAGATFSADQRIVIGLATARNATLDSIATNAWFRIEGANLDILWETDDTVTDDDDNDSGIDIVDNTYTVFKIDASDLTQVKFYVDGVLAGTGAMSSTATVQPYIEIQRDAGTELESVDIDYVSVVWNR